MVHIAGLPEPLRGPDLKAERVRRGLRAADVAARLGVGTRRVSTVENQWRPPASFVRRYLAALAEIEGRG